MPIKTRFETAVSRRKFVAGDSAKACKTATGHSCKPLAVMRENKH